MKKNKNKIMLFNVFLLICLVLVGCSDKSQPLVTDSGTSGVEQGQKESGGTLIWAMTSSILPGLDTSMVGNAGTEGHRTVGFQLYDSLTKYDLSKPGGSADIIGGLAESWELSEDSLEYTFHLRKGVKFHDGSDWNADVAVFNFDRTLNPDSPHYNERLAGQAAQFLSHVGSYRKIDDYTLQITTKKPYALLPNELVYVEMGSMEAIQKLGDEGFAKHPVGTGPFKFTEAVAGQYIVMERNEDYWGGAPKLDRVVLRPIPDASSRLAALRSGEVNFIDVPPPDSLDQLKKDGYVISMQDYPYIWPIFFDTSQPPFDDVKVRQALNYAIDKETLATNVLNGAAVAPYAFTTKDDIWFDPDIKGYPYNPKKAKELLAEAGYPEGFEIKFYYPTSGSGNMWPIPIMEFVQSNLRDIGVKVDAISMEWSALIKQFAAGNGLDAPEDGGWMASVQTYQRFFWYQGFHSGRNFMNYSNPEIDKMLEEAFAIADEEARNALMKKVHKKLMEEIPLLLVTRDRLLRVLSPKVHGFVQAQANFLDITSVWVEK